MSIHEVGCSIRSTATKKYNKSFLFKIKFLYLYSITIINIIKNMKQLTKQAVKAAMDLLISANGQTTTLEVKGHLRELDFEANQSVVSSMMSEIESESADYSFTANGTYRVYTFNLEVEDEDYDDEDEDEIFYSDYEDEDYDDDFIDVYDDDFIDEDLTEDDFTNVSAGSFLDVIDEDDEDEIDQYNASKIAARTQTTGDAIQDAINDVNSAVVKNTQVLPLGTYFTINHAITSTESLHDQNVWIVKATDTHDVIKRDGTKLLNIPVLTFDSSLTSDKVRSRYATIVGVKIQDVRAKRANKYDI